MVARCLVQMFAFFCPCRPWTSLRSWIKCRQAKKEGFGSIITAKHQWHSMAIRQIRMYTIEKDFANKEFDQELDREKQLDLSTCAV